MAESDRAERPAQEGPDSVAAFLSQLYAPAYVADMRPRAAATSAVREARPHSRREPVPGVLLISRTRDSEFDAVSDLLRRVGVRMARINADDGAASDLVVDPARGAVRVSGRWFTPTVAWLRHFTAQAIQGVGGQAHDLFLRESWASAADELVGVAATGIRSRSPGVLAQLRLAERHGIAVPRTVLTTDPYQMTELLGGPRLVIKAAHRHFVEPTPGSLTGVFPAIVTRRELTPPPRPGPPVIVQEYVEHEAEFRVYYVAGQVHGFQIDKDAPADIWLHSDRVLVRAVDLPPPVIRAARMLATTLSLRYCAFDFLLRDAEPVFLEMDPAGDWCWIESRAGESSVTMAVARMLCDLHRANLSTAIGNSPQQGSFDLLAFLAGSASGVSRVEDSR